MGRSSIIGVCLEAATNSSGEILAIRAMALCWADIIKKLTLCENLYNLKSTDERHSSMADLIPVIRSNQRRGLRSTIQTDRKAQACMVCHC